MRKRENEKTRQFYASRFTFYVSRFTFYVSRFTLHAWLSGLLVFWFCVVIVTPSLLNAQTNPPSEKKHPTLDEILNDDSSMKQIERLEEETAKGTKDAPAVPNLFFHVDAFIAKLAIFVPLLLIIYEIIVIGFNNALEKDKPPLPAFFRFNAIFISSILVLGFLCFSEYTYRRGNVVATGIVDHFRKVNWLLWGLLVALVFVLLVVSQRRRFSREVRDK